MGDEKRVERARRLEAETDTAMHREILGDDLDPSPIGGGVGAEPGAAAPARSSRGGPDQRRARAPSRAALRRSRASAVRGWLKGLIPYRLAGMASVLAVLLAALPILLSWPGLGEILDRYDAGVAILTLTVIAVIWYTAVTYDSVELSRRLSETAEMRRLASLSSRAGMLADRIEALPGSVSVGDEFGRVVLWDPTDEEAIVEAAIGQAPEIIAQAREAVRAASWVRRKVEEIQRANLQTAHMLAGEMSSTWGKGRKEALEKLISLEADARVGEEKARRRSVVRHRG